MNTTTINAGTYFKNTVISTIELQNKLKAGLTKITCNVETMIGEEDIITGVLLKLDIKGLIPVSLEKYDFELTKNGTCMIATLEFLVIERGV